MDLQGAKTVYSTENDAIVIQNCVGEILGGAVLDTSSFSEEVVKAGHIIIQEDSSGTYKPLAVSSGNYVAIPESHTVVGVAKTTVLKEKALVGIMTMGQVNKAASPFMPAQEVLDALTNIQFM